MKKESEDRKKFERDKVKVYGPMRFIKSIKYSLDGLFYAYRYEQSLWIHGCAVLLAVILGFIFQIRLAEWAIIFIALGIILALELINTAIEAVVDMISLEKSPQAKLAKDISAGAVLVFAIVAAIIGLIIFIPKILELF